MKFSTLTQRIASEGSDAWALHYEALARREAGEPILILSVGQESDEFTPDLIVDAAIASLKRGRHHYSPVSGLLELREAIANHHHKLTGQTVSVDHCAVFAGAQNALFSVAQCILEQGDEVILIEPYYTTYPAAFSASGAKIVSVAVRAEDDFEINPETIRSQITERTRAIVLNSPNNPVGATYSREQFQAVVDLCEERGIWLVSDEVYLEMLPEGERISPASLTGADSIVVTVSSLSKSHRMTGWRIGWVVGPVALMEHLRNLAMCMCYGLPQFTMDAAVAALTSDIDVAAEVRATLSRRREIVINTLGHLADIETVGTGGMFILLDTRRLAVCGWDFARRLLDEYRVSVLPCDGFGPSGEGLLRVSLCASDENMKIACEHIADLVQPPSKIPATHRQPAGIA